MTLLRDLEDVSTFAPNGTIGLRLNTRIRGVRVVLEHVVRRWITGPLAHPADPTMILDIAAYINHDPTDSELRRLPAQLTEQARRVDFVKQARVNVSFTDGNLAVRGTIEVFEAGLYPLNVDIRNARLVVGFNGVL